MNNRIGTYLLILAAAISMVTAMAHLSCLILGPQCYAAQMAPKVIITSAQNGTMFAPITNIMISSLFIICGIYALSAAKVIRTLPWLTWVIYLISTVCIIRGLLGIQLWIRHPHFMDLFAISVSFAWLISGLLFLMGYRLKNN